jgi:hypothetical protein
MYLYNILLINHMLIIYFVAVYNYTVGHVYMNEVNKAYASVQDLSTPSDTSTWMKW